MEVFKIHIEKVLFCSLCYSDALQEIFVAKISDKKCTP